MISETKERGNIKWRIIWTGINGGIIQTRIERNRISFVKKFIFNENETFEIAQKILTDNVSRILHFKNSHIGLQNLAQYACEAKTIEKVDSFTEKDI